MLQVSTYLKKYCFFIFAQEAPLLYLLWTFCGWTHYPLASLPSDTGGIDAFCSFISPCLISLVPQWPCLASALTPGIVFPKVPPCVFYILSLLLDPLSSCLLTVSAYFFSTFSSLTSSWKLLARVLLSIFDLRMLSLHPWNSVLPGGHGISQLPPAGPILNSAPCQFWSSRIQDHPDCISPISPSCTASFSPESWLL